MITGLLGAIFWALDTVVLGIALAMSPFVATEQAIILAPFISTFLHDASAAVWMLIYNGIRKQMSAVFNALKTRSGKFIMLGALLGGPIGMTCYVSAINYIGPGYTAVISSMYPALGTFLAAIFLKEKIKPIQLFGLFISICGVIALGYTPGGSAQAENFGLGFLCAIMCCIGWACEGVIVTYGMRDPNVNNEQALQIRQLTSALFYGVVIITALKGWNLTLDILPNIAGGIVVLSALFGTISYLCYYKAMHLIGVAKAMALNITYSAWSLVFALVLLGTVPDIKSIVCGVVIIIGSLICATDVKELLGFKKSL